MYALKHATWHTWRTSGYNNDTFSASTVISKLTPSHLYDNTHRTSPVLSSSVISISILCCQCHLYIVTIVRFVPTLVSFKGNSSANTIYCVLTFLWTLQFTPRASTASPRFAANPFHQQQVNGVRRPPGFGFNPFDQMALPMMTYLFTSLNPGHEPYWSPSRSACRVARHANLSGEILWRRLGGMLTPGLSKLNWH